MKTVAEYRQFAAWCRELTAKHEALYRQGKPIVEMDYPRAKAVRQVPKGIRERLARRAIALGHGAEASAA